jgi:putative sterol carrier protein
VIELDATTWVALATGEITWRQAMDEGRVRASGERADLSPYLPLTT